VQVLHICALEWNVSIKHSIEYDASTPHIYSPSIIALLCNDFRSDIGRSAALVVESCTWLNLLPNSKISNLDVAMVIKQDVL